MNNLYKDPEKAKQYNFLQYTASDGTWTNVNINFDIIALTKTNVTF